MQYFHCTVQHMSHLAACCSIQSIDPTVVLLGWHLKKTGSSKCKNCSSYLCRMSSVAKVTNPSDNYQWSVGLAQLAWNLDWDVTKIKYQVLSTAFAIGKPKNSGSIQVKSSQFEPYHAVEKKGQDNKITLMILGLTSKINAGYRKDFNEWWHFLEITLVLRVCFKCPAPCSCKLLFIYLMFI